MTYQNLIIEEPIDFNQLTSKEDDCCVKVSILTEESYTTTTTGVDLKKKPSINNYLSKDTDAKSGLINTELHDPFTYLHNMYWRRQYMKSLMKSLKFHYRYSEDVNEI